MSNTAHILTMLDIVTCDTRAMSISEGMINDDAVVLVDEELVPNPPEGNFKVHALPRSRDQAGYACEVCPDEPGCSACRV